MDSNQRQKIVLITTLKEERKQADGAFGIWRVMTSDEVDGDWELSSSEILKDVEQ